ncbi:MAG TPA: NUDIX domain-containing protein [Tepidiformaceae bacterium]
MSGASADVNPLERHHTATAYVVSRGRTLMLWHRKLRMWLPPGGHCELNEDPVQAALREAREESGLEVEIIPPPDLVRCEGPVVLPPPAVILIEDIVRDDQPFHQHIDHVYFTRAVEPVDFDAPIPDATIFAWVDAATLEIPCTLPGPDGQPVSVAEDVRLLGVRAIDAAAKEALIA